jgi:hypothetical protein
MPLLKSFFLCAIIGVLAFSCNKEEEHTDKFEVTGVIQKQGFTTHQYGTHTIDVYTLRSSAVNLDDYVNQRVTVVGEKIDGYPIDGGPEYIEVEEIK